jgi:hypothetical protein
MHVPVSLFDKMVFRNYIKVQFMFQLALLGSPFSNTAVTLVTGTRRELLEMH